MPYDEELARRVRDLVGGAADVAEQRMFGGLAFLAGGHLAIAASGQGGLLVRIAPEDTAALLAQPGVRPFEMRGREMDGWVRVDPEAVQTAEALDAWVDRGLRFARSLPPKA